MALSVESSGGHTEQGSRLMSLVRKELSAFPASSSNGLLNVLAEGPDGT